MGRLFFCALLSATTTVALAQTPPPIGVWRSNNVRWIHAPKALGYRERAGGARILRFSPDGKFTMVLATVIERNRQEVVSRGDPWTVYAGRWLHVDGRLQVSYALSYQDIQRVDQRGAPVAEPAVTNLPLLFKDGLLYFREDILVQDAKLAKIVNEAFSDPPSMPPTRGAP